MPEIGLARPGDARRVAEVHVRARRAAYRGLIPEAHLAAESVDDRETRWRLRLSDDDGRCWLLEEDGALLGFAHTARATDGDLPRRAAELVSLYLLPEVIGRGLGRRLTGHGLEDLERRGFSEVVLWVAEENLVAMRFYAAAGFATDPRVGPIPFGETGLTRRRLWRALGPAGGLDPELRAGLATLRYLRPMDSPDRPDRAAPATDTDDPPARAVQADREAAIERLSVAFAEDHLSAQEFERLVDDVYRVTTRDALVRLTSSLPATEPAHLAAARPGLPARIATVLSNVERGGAVTVPTEVAVRTILGNIELDLRDAELSPGVTTISVRALLGNIEILLPPDVAIECDGSAVLGSFEQHGAGPAPAPAGGSVRTVRVEGRVVLGNVEVGRG